MNNALQMTLCEHCQVLNFRRSILDAPDMFWAFCISNLDRYTSDFKTDLTLPNIWHFLVLLCVVRKFNNRNNILNNYYGICKCKYIFFSHTLFKNNSVHREISIIPYTFFFNLHKVHLVLLPKHLCHFYSYLEIKKEYRK